MPLSQFPSYIFIQTHVWWNELINQAEINAEGFKEYFYSEGPMQYIILE